MRPSSLWLAAFAAACAFAWPSGRPAAQPNATAAAPAASSDAVVSPHYGAWGYDESGRDLRVSPGTDFFSYANGDWLQREQIPADRSRFGVYDQLVELSQNRTRLLMQRAASGGLRDLDAGKVGDAYKAFMNQALVNALDAQPLRPELAAIAVEHSRAEVAAAMGRSAISLQGSLFALEIGADAHDSHAYAVYIDVAGLGLPNRDYYVAPEFADKKAAYQAYVGQMLGAIDWPNAQEAAREVVEFETELAEVSWPRGDNGPSETYNPTLVSTLAIYAPAFDFKAFLESAGLGSRKVVVLRSNAAFPQAARVFWATPLDALEAWQAFHLVDNAAPYLSDRFMQARFAFRNKTLAGQPEIQPRSTRASDFVNGILGEAVGRLYVQSYFPPEAKAKVETLVDNLREALRARIERADWMSDATKAKAVQKLSMLTIKIGYPAKWRDYSALEIRPDDLYGDARRARAFDWQRQVKRLDQPVDKQDWSMTPQTVNAYYSPTNNEVVFPAAILEPPFFDPDADPAVNYGGIGAVIGHEMTHGFDDQGRKYDGDGRLDSWWSPADSQRFDARAQRLGKQYDTYEPVSGAHINGALTMAENIADLGGVLVALDAYHMSLHGEPAPVMDGLSGDQRFFLGYAQIWREKIRDDYERQLIVSDVHSPSYFRLAGVVRNVDAWYAAFDIKPTDATYVPPDLRVSIW